MTELVKYKNVCLVKLCFADLEAFPNMKVWTDMGEDYDDT